MSPKISKELAIHRLEQAKEDLTAGKLLYNSNLYKSANNRAYYSIFHSIKAVLALEPIDFKRHKDVLAYFNKNYINTEIFPKMMGRKIINSSNIREDSDYDDEFVVDANKTKEQLSTAEELIQLVEEYLSSNKN
ncbi:MAG: HEPN domain-containing protein [Clostridia bacterium]|nr:HEPN domain-containing protein [Clostridia bacterium]